MHSFDKWACLNVEQQNDNTNNKIQLEDQILNLKTLFQAKVSDGQWCCCSLFERRKLTKSASVNWSCFTAPAIFIFSVIIIVVEISWISGFLEEDNDNNYNGYDDDEKKPIFSDCSKKTKERTTTHSLERTCYGDKLWREKIRGISNVGINKLNSSLRSCCVSVSTQAPSPPRRRRRRRRRPPTNLLLNFVWRCQNEFASRWTSKQQRSIMPTSSSPEMSLIDRNIDVNHIGGGHIGHVTPTALLSNEKRKMMKTNSSSSASPNSTFDLIPEETEAGKNLLS